MRDLKMSDKTQCTIPEHILKVVDSSKCEEAFLVNIVLKSGVVIKHWFHKFEITSTSLSFTVANPLERIVWVRLEDISAVEQIDYVPNYLKFYVRKIPTTSVKYEVLRYLREKNIFFD